MTFAFASLSILILWCSCSNCFVCVVNDHADTRISPRNRKIYWKVRAWSSYEAHTSFCDQIKEGSKILWHYSFKGQWAACWSVISVCRRELRWQIRGRHDNISPINYSFPTGSIQLSPAVLDTAQPAPARSIMVDYNYGLWGGSNKFWLWGGS